MHYNNHINYNHTSDINSHDIDIDIESKMRFVNDNRVVDLGENKRHMEVIAAGLPRTATSSLQAALESGGLGMYPSMHMAHVIPKPEISRIVIAAMNEENKDKRHKLLAKVFDGCAATCDFPGVAFTDDLMDMYPDAKVILNQRDNALQWAASIKGALMFFNSWPFYLATILFPTDRLHVRMQVEAYWHFQRKLGLTIQYNDDFFVEWYTKYNAWVKKEAEARNMPLMEWKPQEGWKPICDFLDKPVPQTAFPRVNDRAEMHKVKVYLMVRGVLAWAAVGAGLFVALSYGPSLLGNLKPVVSGGLRSLTEFSKA